MHPIAIVILIFMLLDFLVGLTADVLNLRAIRTRLPEKWTGWYPSEQYERSQAYLKATTRFGWLTGSYQLLLFLGFWFCGGFAWLDNWVRALALPPLINGLVYIGTLVIVKSVLGLPFGLYSTFGIEARFGFNRTTWKTYIKDHIKGAVLAVVLGVPLLSAILAFFQYAGANAWWYCWLVTVGFMLVMQYIAPAWIMPLFNRYDPLPEGDLRQAIFDYARRIDFRLDNIFVMDGSKRSTKSNAFFTGFGKNRRIVLFDTLTEKHTVDELVAILAHEMGHFKKKHILQNLSIGIVQAGAMFYILSLFISYPGLFQAFYVKQVSVYAGLIFFGVIYAPLDNMLALALQAISRRHEYQADRFAVQTSGDKNAMIDALKKLSVHNLSNLQPHPFYVFLHYSHPPVLRRIEAIETMAIANGHD
jgi:STE24 endopeptidase